MGSFLFSRFSFLLFLLVAEASFTLAMDEAVSHDGENQNSLLIPDQLISLNKSHLTSTLEDLNQVGKKYYFFQFFDLKTLSSLSRTDHFYREFLYPQKLQHLLDAPAYTLPEKNIYSLVKMLRKIALDEEFMYGLNDLRPTKQQSQYFKGKNKKIIFNSLTRSKFMHYSPTFRFLNGPKYRDEIAIRHGRDISLTHFQKLKAMCLSIRQDPLIMYGSAAVLLTSYLAVSYDIYANYYQLNYRYGYYTDQDDCTIFYAKAPLPFIGNYHEQSHIPLCPKNGNQEWLLKSNEYLNEFLFVNGQLLKDQLMGFMLSLDVYVLTFLLFPTSWMFLSFMVL